MRSTRLFIVGVLLAAGAWTASALTVTPGRTYVSLTPGKSIKGTISAHNETSERIQVEVSKKDWFTLPANKGITVESWLKIKGPTYFWLAPGESRSVPIEVKCPKKAEGELVGMTSFAYQPENPGMVTPMISVSVYLSVAGTERVSGFISDFAIRRWQDRTQVAIGVKSTGNVHLRPIGSVTVVDATGKEVHTFPIKEGDPAYPGSERGYFAEDKQFKLAPGQYVATATLQYKDLELKATKDILVKADGSIDYVKGLKTETSTNRGTEGGSAVK